VGGLIDLLVLAAAGLIRGGLRLAVAGLDSLAGLRLAAAGLDSLAGGWEPRGLLFRRCVWSNEFGV